MLPCSYTDPTPPQLRQPRPSTTLTYTEPTRTLTRDYTDINILLQDIRDGDSEAIAYMAELNRYTEECGKIEMEKTNEWG